MANYFLKLQENLMQLIGKLRMLDNQKISLGTGEDSSIYYDGTNLVVDPKEDGSGVVSLNGGNLATTGQVSANNISVGTTSPSVSFRGEGDIYATSGIKAMEGLYAEAKAYGAGIEVLDHDLTVTYTNVMYGDATLTAATRLITDSHAAFDSTYVGQYLRVISSTPSFTGATGEIIAAPSSTTLILSFGTSANDTIVDATAMSFVIYPHPVFFAGDNGDLHSRVGINIDASFKIQCKESNNDHAVHLDITAGKDNNCGLEIEYDPDTYGGASAMCVSFDATDFDAADRIGTVNNVIINNVGATDGDIHGIDVALSDPGNTDLEVGAVATHEGVGVIHQHLGTPAALDSAWSYDTNAFTDRTTAFNDAGTDVAIFSSDNDYILLASDTKWDEINVVNATDSSHSIVPTFHYITDAGAWVAFTPADDSNGFSQSGTIRFDSDNLATWGVRTINEVTGEAGADDYYWIKITRTRNNLPTSPTEDTIQITTLGTEHQWDKDGNIDGKTIAVTDGITAPDAIVGQAIVYVDTADGNLKVKFGDGHVATIATDS